ncbi:MAG: lecithin retinol acyltransferase family protein [Lautropia sp.]
MSTPSSAACTIPVGAHLSTPRRGFTHHGIHVGGGRVIHYPGSSRGVDVGPVTEVSLEEFARGRGWRIESTPCRFAAAEVVRRARSRIGENAYCVTNNNCEHLCNWCRTGFARSEQVEVFTRPIARLLERLGASMPALLQPTLVTAA